MALFFELMENAKLQFFLFNVTSILKNVIFQFDSEKCKNMYIMFLSSKKEMEKSYFF